MYGYDKDVVLKHFFFNGQNITVLRIEETGQHFLGQGHHRLAALIEAVQEEWIPSDWLKDIPVEVTSHKTMQEKDKMHGQVLAYFLTGGQSPLTWSDVLGKPVPVLNEK